MCNCYPQATSPLCCFPACFYTYHFITNSYFGVVQLSTVTVKGLGTHGVIFSMSDMLNIGKK